MADIDGALVGGASLIGEEFIEICRLPKCRDRWSMAATEQVRCFRLDRELLGWKLTETLVSVVHVLASVALVGLILLQHGKGADAELRLKWVPLRQCSALRVVVPF